MTQTLGINDWIKKLRAIRPGGMTRRKSLLVWGASYAHRTPTMKTLLADEFKTMPTIIPSGITSVLQPLDVSVNKPMKSILQRMWTE